MKLLFLAGSLLLTGCEAPSSQLIEFETTNSPCLDAMIINMKSAMCQNIVTSISHEDEMSYHYCSDKNPEDSTWNSTRFITVSHESYYSYETMQNASSPFCEDPNLVMFIDS